MDITSFESPESSSITSARYDETTRAMFVTFRVGTDFKEYRYDGFPEELWTEFATAPSKGLFFNQCIRPFHSGKRV